jgi:hypothetical protein
MLLRLPVRWQEERGVHVLRWPGRKHFPLGERCVNLQEQDCRGLNAIALPSNVHTRSLHGLDEGYDSVSS